MRDYDESTITRAVVDSFRITPDPRLRQIMISLTEHLHDFVRDVELTFAEWQYAIEFLTRTGQTCTATRQEFILLSDTLGVSMLVDAINHGAPEEVTETTVLGPFYVQNPPELPHGADVSHGQSGEPLYVEGTVRSADGQMLDGAVIDIWHSDPDGFYDVQRSDLEEPTFRARFRTDVQGQFHFWSIMPKFYPIPDDGPVGEMLKATERHPYRPAHVHFMIGAPGHETLITHVYAADSPYLDSDAVFGVKRSLVAAIIHEAPGIAPDGRVMDKPWRRLSYDFSLKPAEQVPLPFRARSDPAE
ncbi:intradiol ring-cleavage dioxygenase (plasmid) [Microvirga terrae]|uniref:Intradiol ring-cleavage dioxygenase n=1 Tax=Microvirga terrae TaxID=2740529 RepID=A0ABY5RYX0_9HYPH|nr:intradiol ring-cleavage dioxygenase [Microvirga terrae]UVF22208.1 intradiol ring-cleavage dioxygenase [Microvirga terrae]